MTTCEALDEPVLADDYPVYAGYAYVVDGKPISSPLQGTVRRLKVSLKVSEVRRCDIVGRQLAAEKDNSP